MLLNLMSLPILPRLQGVTIPSQRRYVEYYDQLLKMGGPGYSLCPLELRELTLEPIPSMSGGCGKIFLSHLLDLDSYGF